MTTDIDRGHFAFMGYPIVEDQFIPERQPKIELSYEVDVSPKFRAEFNSWLRESFGEMSVVYMFNGRYFMHPNNVVKLKLSSL